METATPGVKSTGDGWLNRYLQAHTSNRTARFVRSRSPSQLPRVLQGSAPALAMNQSAHSALRAESMNARSRRSTRRRPIAC